MLMFISFPAITDEWNDVLAGTFASSIAIRVGDVNPIFKSTAPVLLSLHQWFGVDAVESGQDIER